MVIIFKTGKETLLRLRFLLQRSDGLKFFAVFIPKSLSFVWGWKNTRNEIDFVKSTDKI